MKIYETVFQLKEVGLILLLKIERESIWVVRLRFFYEWIENDNKKGN